MILGIDLSTTSTGFAVIKEKQLIWQHRCDLSKEKLFFDKADKIKNKLTEINNQFDIKHVFIETPAMMFKAGKSSAETICLLQRFSGAIYYICSIIFCEIDEPIYIASTTARKLFGLTIKRGTDAKKAVLDKVKQEYPSFYIEYTKFDKPKPWVYDMSDAVCIAVAGYELIRKQTKDSS